MLKYPLSDLALHVGYQSRVSTSFDWLSSCYHCVIVSPFHHVIVLSYWIWHCMWDINHGLAQALIGYHRVINDDSSCHRFTMSSCHHVIMSSCCHIIVSSCHHVIMSSCHHVIVSSCHCVIMSLFLSSSHRVIMSSCHHIIVSSCYHIGSRIACGISITS